jgi:hypothetical protein
LRGGHGGQPRLIGLAGRIPTVQSDPQPPSEPGAQAEEVKTPAAARLAEVEAQLAAARAELAPKLDALAVARAAAVDGGDWAGPRSRGGAVGGAKS